MSLPPFDGSAYRKSVLAAVDARGGPEQSDPFELYDLPLADAERLGDVEVADRIDAVWAFWQKQRDHPKYRGTVTAMLAAHRQVAGEMRTAGGRRRLAAMSRASRAERDSGRTAELDAALDRLVERFGGVPADKVEGLRRLAAGAGVPDAEFEAQLRGRPALAAAPSMPVPTVPEPVYRQVCDDLDELAQLDGTPPPAGLFDLLRLPPGAGREEVRAAREALATANRARRPDRRRALVDDLLAAVSALLLDGDPDRYLDRCRADVLVLLRPRVAAAVLVEDELTAEDHRYLVGLARQAGLDAVRAASVLAELAGEFGVAVPAASAASRRHGGAAAGRVTPLRPVVPARPVAPQRPAPRPAAPPRVAPPVAGTGSYWQERLTAAREAMRSGRPGAAGEHVAAAQQAAGGLLPPIRVLRDEIEAVLEAARQSWRGALDALSGRRVVAALNDLERLAETAADVPGPRDESVSDLLARARADLRSADAAVAGAAGEMALLDVLASVADHAGAREALGRLGVAPARNVRAVPVPGGTRVSWTASTSPGPVDYRVLRVIEGGATRPVGVTGGTELEEGATGATAYIVIARRAGVLAPQARSDRADPEPPVLDTPVPVPGVSLPDVPVPGAPVPDGPVSGAPQPAAPAPVGDLSVVPFGRRIRLVYPVPPGGRAEVRRLLPGLVPPAPGTRPGNPDELGPVVPAMGPGLAIDRRPPAGVTEYVVLGEGVCGPSAAFVDLPAVTDLRREDGRLRWTWPSACTEVLLALRSDAPPASATDPGASTRKVTNTRYEIDGGVDVPAEGHAAVFTCVRIGGRLRVATEASATARIALT